jgi:Transposase
VLNEDGERVSWSRIDNTAANLAAEIVAAGGPSAEVAMEATWGWYWAADVIAECGATLHLAHPLGIAGYENRRVKNDIVDATLLADLLRMGRLPEAWIAPPAIRELREAVRYRAKLSKLRAGLKAQVHQTLGKEGVIPQLDSIWGSGGRQWLNELRLGDEYVNRIESLRDLIEFYDREIHQCDVRIYRRLKGHPGYEAVQALRGVGPGAGRRVRRRDRRRHAVLERGPVVFMGRADPTPPRIRFPRQPWSGHQARGLAVALGGGGSSLRGGARPQDRFGQSPCRRPTGSQHRPCRRRPPAADAGLLRAARRRDPLPRHSGMKSGHGQRATRERHDPPAGVVEHHD